jgi:hypothetical protein
MTLIVSLANEDYVVQISDRRLSSNGRLIDDESNKCGVVFCLNARMAFGYTGLARYGSFSTAKWLLKALNDSANPNYTIGEILENLKDKATETFKNHTALRGLSNSQKALAVMFTGFINIDGTLKPGCAILSNYHNFSNNTRYDEVADEFSVSYNSANKEAVNPTLVQRVGNWRAMSSNDIDELRELLLQGVPSEAVVGKTLEVVRDIAGRPKSSGTIGKQLTSICLPKDPNLGVESSYSSDVVKPETYMPALVYLLPDQHMTVDNISVRPVEADTPPISVPKVRRKAPCPCGSNKKYKHCHGKKDNKALQRTSR